LQALGYLIFGLLIVLIGFDLQQPSPYDFLAPAVMLLWLAMGVKVPRSSIFFFALLLTYGLSLVLALVPYLDNPKSVEWVGISLYLIITAVFFTMFFSEETQRRVELALKAFLASCALSAIAAIIGYFDLAGSRDLFSKMGRATGTFEDPNVFGSFLILGVLYLLRDFVTGEGRHVFLRVLIFPLLLTGVFLSFSRGSWIATATAAVALLTMTFVTSSSRRDRRRIVGLSLFVVVMAAGSIVALLASDEVRAMFDTRAEVQSYDEGETGRFGNQLRAIPALIENPLGFGPLRYRFIFGFDPHNSYLSSFANGGWLGGLAFIGLMLATTYIGMRLALKPSPYSRQAQILVATHLTFVLQSFQIDLDHWRHVFLVWGAIWGLEVARLRWLARFRLPVWSRARSSIGRFHDRGRTPAGDQPDPRYILGGCRGRG